MATLNYSSLFLSDLEERKSRAVAVIRCSSTTCIGVAGAQLSVSVTTLAAAIFMLQLDLRFDAALSPPPRHSDAQICTAVSMVPLTSVTMNIGNSCEDPGGSPPGKDKESLVSPQPPT